MTWRRPSATTLALAAAVAVAFADASIVVLALPDLYVHFHTTIFGVSWVISAYNLVVALAAIALLPFTGRFPRGEVATGLAIFLCASVACGLSWSLAALIAFRCVQGFGAALLLAGSLPIFTAFARSARRGIAVWTAAGAVGVAIGPALGGLLTELDWRAVFFAQAPVAALGLAALVPRHVPVRPEPADARPRWLAADAGLVLLFGAVVGALFLAVLLVVNIWQFSPIAGAGVVSALPIASLVTRRLTRDLSLLQGVAAGSLLLAGGLLALALLPRSSAAYAVPALAICGAGFGLAVPPLTSASVEISRPGSSATLSVAARHLGLLLGLLAVAPVLATTVTAAGDRALLNATGAILDAHLSLTKKIPIALSFRDELTKAQEGSIPNLSKPFEKAGAGHDARVAAARDQLAEATRAPLTRSFRPAFAIAALFAASTLIPLAVFRRRLT